MHSDNNRHALSHSFFESLEILGELIRRSETWFQINSELRSNILKVKSRFENRIDLITRSYSNLSEKYFSKLDLDLEQHSEILNEINDLELYLLLLNQIKEKYLIIISVKDTPGYILNEHHLEKFKKLGFSDFSSELWRPFVGVLENSSIVFEKFGRVEEKIELKTMMHGHELNIVSGGLKSGNISSVKINGIEYSQNVRGINILVYDVKNNLKVDSVAFDMHDPNLSVYRNGK